MRCALRVVLLAAALTTFVGGVSHACIGTDCLEIFSTADGGGALTISWDFGNRKVQVFGRCFPAGGCLYSAIDPGFITQPGTPPDGFYPLADGTDVTLQIVDIDPAVTIKIEGVPLRTAGATALLGTAPTLHEHPSWQLVVGEGERGDYPISFKLTTTSSVYSESAVFAVVVTNEATPTPNEPSPTATATPTVTSRHPSCPGDCDANGVVVVNELVNGVNAALGRASTCESACDLNGDGSVTGDADGSGDVQINELILAVNNALHGCPRLPITLNFRGVVGEQAFACANVYQGIGTAASRFIPSDFRFYVSNIKLITVAGDEIPVELDQSSLWQYRNVAMIDFETGPNDGCGEGNSATNTAVTGSVPAGIYTGLKFDLGLPFDLDHGDASVAPSPLNFSAMFWTWNDGYKFFRLDTLDGNFRVHLGSTGCNGASSSEPPESCDRPNVATITLNGFSPSHSIIDADLAALLADSNIDANQPGSSLGCMSADDQDCAAVFRNLGLNFPAGTSSGNTQKFFRLEAASATAHKEIKVAGGADAGGMLRAHTEFDLDEPLALSFDDCFGGSDAACTGGMRLFSAANRGIVPLTESDPVESVFKLADGVPVTLEIVALDDGLTIHYGDVVLDTVGASVLLGQTPNFHADLEPQLLIPGGTASRTYSASFKLTTTSSAYTASDVFTVKFIPTEPSS